MLSVPFLSYYPNSGSYKKHNNGQYCRLPIYSFSQQCLNGAADWSAAEGDQVLPHLEHIVSGALTPLCPISQEEGDENQDVRGMGGRAATIPLWSVVGHQLVHNKGCGASGGFPPRE
jgi:hypothetical protein